jgi:hypothetical protein
VAAQFASNRVALRTKAQGNNRFTDNGEVSRFRRAACGAGVLRVGLVAKAVVEGFVHLVDLFAPLAQGVLAGVTGGDPTMAA